MFPREAEEYVCGMRREEAGEEDVHSREFPKRLLLQKVRRQGTVSAREAEEYVRGMRREEAGPRKETNPVSEKKKTARRNGNSKTNQ